MLKDYNCAYSIMDVDVICQHKNARRNVSPTNTLHNHDGYEIILFLGGDNISIYIEDENKIMTRGDLVLVDSYEFHGAYCPPKSDYERVVINIEDEYIREISTSDTDLSYCFHHKTPNMLNIIHLSEAQIGHFLSISTNLENALSSTSYGSSILKRAYLSELLVYINLLHSSLELPYQPSTLPPIVSKTLEYIEKNLSTDLTVEHIAASLHHNSDYLSRSFKDSTGHPLKNYITAKRISLAQKLIREGMSPYDACFSLAFNNYSSFARTFMKQTGCSPKKYQSLYLLRMKASEVYDKSPKSTT